MFPNVWGQITETIDRMQDNIALANAQNAGGAMNVEPDKADEIAAFFRDKATMLLDRSQDVMDLANIEPVGGDPVSTGSAEVYAKVAQGQGNGYSENYLALAKVLNNAADALEENARQWRLDDQNSADSFGGGRVEA